MYNIKLTDYVPEPKPATSDCVIAAHYYAAWKKGSAGLHNAFDDLHEYPERTPLMGYYDEENPEVCDWEIKWAVEHGVNCFIHCWYRLPHNAGKPVTEQDLRCGHGLHEALFNAKYQQMMKFAIMFEASPRWAATDSQDIVENLMPFWMENYFKRGNYLVIDNKPVLFMYNPVRLEECWPDPAENKAAFDACREYAKKEGFDGMIFALCDTDTTKEAAENAVARGYDFRYGYNCGYRPLYGTEKTSWDVVDIQCDLLETRLKHDPMRFVPTASCFWDPTPRRTKHWCDLGYDWFYRTGVWYLQPDEFRVVVRRMKEMMDALPEGAWGKRIFMLDNWNEWDEGHFIAPSVQFGFRYLQAVREELTWRDNLPDYRTPQDLGLSGNLNKSWEEPDLANVSKRYRCLNNK